MEMLTYHNKNNRRTTYVIVYNEMTKIKSYFLDGGKISSKSKVYEKNQNEERIHEPEEGFRLNSNGGGKFLNNQAHFAPSCQWAGHLQDVLKLFKGTGTVNKYF